MNNNEYITDDCIIEDDVYSGVKDIVKCKICSKILKDPMICRDCQNVYCKACIDEQKNCPKCNNSEFVSSIDKKALLSLLKFRCKNCKNEIKYNDVESHLNTGCKKNLKENKLIEQIYKKKQLKKLEYDEIEQIRNKGHKINHISSKEYIFYLYLFLFNSNNIGKEKCW